MTRNYYGQLVFSHCIANGAGTVSVPVFFSKFKIGFCFAKRYFTDKVPSLLLECGAFLFCAYSEGFSLSFKIFVQLFFTLLNNSWNNT